MNIRPAQLQDSQFIYDLAMSDDVRNASTRSDHFTFEQHQEWYERRLAETGTRIYIAEGLQNMADTELGYIRYGRVVGTADAEVAIAVAPDCRKKGFALEMLQQTESLAAQELGVTRLIALVLVSNDPSQKLFEKAGYKLGRWVFRLNKPHREYVRQLASLWP